MTRLMEAIADFDHREARDAARDLLSWLRDGGAQPTLTEQQLFTLVQATHERLAMIVEAEEEG